MDYFREAKIKYFCCRCKWYFSSGSPGSCACPGRARRSPGRQSRCRPRWRRWSTRRYPPSHCSPMFLTLMTTSAPMSPAVYLTPITPVMSSLLFPMVVQCSGEFLSNGAEGRRLFVKIIRIKNAEWEDFAAANHLYCTICEFDELWCTLFQVTNSW